MTAELVLAHAGHWTAGLIYLAPVLVVVLAIQSRKDRRSGDDELSPEEDEDDLDI